MQTINAKSLIKKDKIILETKNYSVLQSALSQVGIDEIMVKPSEVNKLPFVFNYQLKEKVSATDQYYSGRCWIFSGLNIFRHNLIEYYNLPDTFELSEAFIFKYDRIEKCNYLLELMYDFSKRNMIYTLEFITILDILNNDGGTINQFINIINKYGIVPKTIYPDNIQVKDTDLLNTLLTTLLKKASTIIHKQMNQTEFNAYKQSVLDECYRLLTMTIGSIPDEFTWTHKDSIVPKKYTPITFYNKIVKPLININDYIVIVNDPRNTYNKLIAIEYLNNIVTQDTKEYKRNISNLYLNVPIKIMKDAIFKTFNKYNTPVWFASDYNYFLMNDETILDPQSSTIQDIFDITILNNKKISLNSRITEPIHAMVIVGCQKENKDYLRWKVENSHGTKNKFNGYLVMSDDFFTNYMMIALVHKNSLPKELRQIYKERKSQDIKWLPFWDILGYSAD